MENSGLPQLTMNSLGKFIELHRLIGKRLQPTMALTFSMCSFTFPLELTLKHLFLSSPLADSCCSGDRLPWPDQALAGSLNVPPRKTVKPMI